MEKQTKILSVSKEIDMIIAESESLRILRDMYAKLPFGYKKAVKCAKESELKRRQFWQTLYALYPEIDKGSWTYNAYAMTIVPKEEG